MFKFSADFRAAQNCTENKSYFIIYSRDPVFRRFWQNPENYEKNCEFLFYFIMKNDIIRGFFSSLFFNKY